MAGKMVDRRWIGICLALLWLSSSGGCHWVDGVRVPPSRIDPPVPCLDHVPRHPVACEPCYGYHPTCWMGWPDCCNQCPPPAESRSILESSAGGASPDATREPRRQGTEPPSVPSETIEPGTRTPPATPSPAGPSGKPYIQDDLGSNSMDEEATSNVDQAAEDSERNRDSASVPNAPLPPGTSSNAEPGVAVPGEAEDLSESSTEAESPRQTVAENSPVGAAAEDAPCRAVFKSPPFRIVVDDRLARTTAETTPIREATEDPPGQATVEAPGYAAVSDESPGYAVVKPPFNDPDSREATNVSAD